jgi:hypothetical protein
LSAERCRATKQRAGGVERGTGLGREGKMTGVQARQHMCQNKNIRRPRVCVDSWWNARGPHFPPVQVQVLHAGGRVARRWLR